MMKDMITLMDKSFPLTPVLIRDLYHSIRLRRYPADQEIPWEDLRYNLIYIKRGLIKEMSIIRDNWRCTNFICEGNLYRIDDFLPVAVVDNARWVTVEPVSMLFISARQLRLLEDEHYPFVKADYTHSREALRRAMINSAYKDNAPTLRIRYLRQKFPDIFQRASVEDLAECLYIDVEKLKTLVSGLR